MRIAVVVFVTATSMVVAGLPREDIDEVVDPPAEEPDWYSSRNTDSSR